MAEQMYQDYLDTPIGLLAIAADDEGVLSILFFDEGDALKSNSNKHTKQTKQQLREYFSGKRQNFDLPLKAKGTDFQCQVWQALNTVEYGNTATYTDIAKTVKRPKAVRAVGSTNGKNLFTIVVPCHRIIGANGSLTGYAGGMKRKAWLLDFERNNAHTD